MDPKVEAALQRVEEAVNDLAHDFVTHQHGVGGGVTFEAIDLDYVLDLSDLLTEEGM